MKSERERPSLSGSSGVTIRTIFGTVVSTETRMALHNFARNVLPSTVFPLFRLKLVVQLLSNNLRTFSSKAPIMCWGWLDVYELSQGIAAHFNYHDEACPSDVTSTPAHQTLRMSLVFLMSWMGFPPINTRSARRPGSITPRSWRPN